MPVGSIPAHDYKVSKLELPRLFYRGYPVPQIPRIVFPKTKQVTMQEIIVEAFKWTFPDAGNFGSIKVKLSTPDA